MECCEYITCDKKCRACKAAYFRDYRRKKAEMDACKIKHAVK